MTIDELRRVLRDKGGMTPEEVEAFIEDMRNSEFGKPITESEIWGKPVFPDEEAHVIIPDEEDEWGKAHSPLIADEHPADGPWIVYGEREEQDDGQLDDPAPAP